MAKIKVYTIYFYGKIKKILTPKKQYLLGNKKGVIFMF